MLKQFFISSLRYLARNRTITIINVAGLTLGVTFSLLIGLYVRKELSIDKDFVHGKMIYRLEFDYPEREKNAVMVSALGPDLKNNIAGIEDVLRIQLWEDIVLKKDNETYFNIPRVCLADSSFFDFFQQTWVYGSPEGALSNPLSIVLTEDLARTIFGDINPVGLTLLSQSGSSALPVMGVIKERDDSHIRYDALLSMVTRSLESSTILHTYSTQQWLTYFKIAGRTDPGILEEQIYKELYELIPNLKDSDRNIGLKVVLNPLRSIYFDRSVGDLAVHGNINLIKVFVAIAVLIILIACINFINLSTAIAIKRAREVGLRKLVGSKKSTLIWQFLIEAFLISFVSTILGVLLAELLLPYFNNLSGSELVITFFDNPYSIPVLIGFIVVTGFLAGIYPAYYISSYKLIQVIRGEISSGRKSLGFRRGLILFQFLLSVILINGSLLISKQLKYTRDTDLGFEKERILTIDLSPTVLRNRENVKERLLQNPGILNVSYSYTIPGSHLNYEGFTINNKEINPQVFSIDPDYIETFGLQIVAGRGFDWSVGSDSVSNCLINETLARELGVDNPLEASFFHDSWYITSFHVKNIRIIGIVKDFHFKSFRTVIEPLMLAWNSDWFGYMNIKIAEGKLASAMENIRDVMNEFAPGVPMKYEFIDDSFDQMYKSDERLGRILFWFTSLAILICVLGLIGLALFMTEQRIREIAILKTYGATVASVILKLIREFILLVAIANLIAFPVVLRAGNKWLDEFVYKTDIDAWIFLTGAFISIAIAL
ncbi:MAG: ABC transporter permease, partial [Bacteroidales bacterium]|nr:ABC transporter permease [Bacteroidales bacterium]